MSISSCGGRRFILVIGGCAITTALLVCAYITEQTWMTVVLALTGAYLTANTAQKVTGK